MGRHPVAPLALLSAQPAGGSTDPDLADDAAPGDRSGRSGTQRAVGRLTDRALATGSPGDRLGRATDPHRFGWRSELELHRRLFESHRWQSPGTGRVAARPRA